MAFISLNDVVNNHHYCRPSPPDPAPDPLPRCQAEARLLKGPLEDLESYLEAVDQLRNNAKFFNSNRSFKSSNGVFNHGNGLLAEDILKPEEEFRQLLNYSKPIEPSQLFDCLPHTPCQSSGFPGGGGDKSNRSDHNHAKRLENAVYTPPTLIPPRIIPLLHDLAVEMVQAGHHQQLLRIYRDIRSSVLEQSLQKLGVERLSEDDVQKMQWEVLQAQAGKYIHYLRVVVKLLFTAEKKVCDLIFEGIEFRDFCFSEVIANSVTILLSFGEAIAKSLISAEKLFMLLDLYEVMHEVQPEIKYIFEGKPCLEMRKDMLALMKRLAQSAQETFEDFKEAVETDDTKIAALDGTVGCLTIFTIRYLKYLFDYQSTLTLLFNSVGKDSNTQLANLTMQIMQALQTNLDGKSKQYKDPALTELFLMNNIYYMVRFVETSEAKDLLGDDWVQRHLRIVQQHAFQYKRVAWAKILQCFSLPFLSPSSGVFTTMVKDRFKSFNMQFEELHLLQCQWMVPDDELRKQLRLSIAEVILPGYRTFIGRYGHYIGKSPQKYMRYTLKEVEAMLDKLFEGNVTHRENCLKGRCLMIGTGSLHPALRVICFHSACLQE